LLSITATRNSDITEAVLTVWGNLSEKQLSSDSRSLLFLSMVAVLGVATAGSVSVAASQTESATQATREEMMPSL
jgi:hypothetical protein